LWRGRPAREERPRITRLLCFRSTFPNVILSKDGHTTPVRVEKSLRFVPLFLKSNKLANRSCVYSRSGSDFKYCTKSDFSCALSPRLKQLS